MSGLRNSLAQGWRRFSAKARKQPRTARECGTYSYRRGCKSWAFRLDSSTTVVSENLSALVADFAAGDRSSLDELMPAVYAELRKMAGRYMSRERSGHTLQTTALLHEAYIRMVGQRTVDWRNRAQLLAIAARMMRRVLLDHAATRCSAKRGGKFLRLSLTDDFALATSGGVDLIDLDFALRSLHEIDPEQASVVELRFFGGLSDEEIGDVIEASPATVRRRWASARLWLARRLAQTRRS